MSDSRPQGIVIIGTPRAGTTLLRRILDAHPRIACPPETYLLSAAARFLHEERFAAGLRIGVLSGLAFAGFEEPEVLARLRGLVFGFLDDHARARGKSRWAEKTAFDAFHLPAIERMLSGHVRFVCIQRHGLDVACSLAELVDKTGGYVQELHDYLRRDPEPLVALAHAWVDAAEHVAGLVERDPLALDLRYEDLVRDPEAVVRRVLEHVGEPYDDTLLARALAEPGQLGFGDWKTYGRAAIDGSSVDRWRTLPSPTASRLAEVCNPMLVRLGYEPVEIDQAPSDEDARHRYAMGLRLQQMRAGKSHEQ
ncbi:sulfotransferase family protein [Paraliomyxa miuraensis]|uniref:sulfotransferase family protein n=1 Tax=Paraliomyxa miuraensis TaxID=376150 RepID=UPI00224EC29B|nr:sulfotransferase [Paraliomyxa miuraensis]MCX4243426.1 sulfotransferase [Paraliomyxa miuraensis]